MVKNESRLSALNIYVIPSDRDCCWSHDLLGDKVILKGESLAVAFDDGSGECTFDIRVTRSDKGRDWRFDKVNVCDAAAAITLKESPP
jgi:hypothetical protein